MGKVIVFANQKGGVGKTTTVVSIGGFLAEMGKKVLLVDFDPQANLSSAVGHTKNPEGIYELLFSKRDIHEFIKSTPQPNMSIIPTNIHLSSAGPELFEMADREFVLRTILTPLKEEFDFILIDCPPSLDLLTINGIAAADYIIVPLQSEFFALQGFLNMLFNTITRIQKNLNPNLKLMGIVFTMFDSRTRLGIEVIEKTTQSIKNRAFFFKTVIPRNIKLAEAPSHGLPINLYDANSLGAERYKLLTQEVIDRAKEA
ncbi:MAG: ParA family protein [Spirochaetia bacterium]